MNGGTWCTRSTVQGCAIAVHPLSKKRQKRRADGRYSKFLHWVLFLPGPDRCLCYSSKFTATDQVPQNSPPRNKLVCLGPAELPRELPETKVSAAQISGLNLRWHNNKERSNLRRHNNEEKLRFLSDPVSLFDLRRLLAPGMALSMANITTNQMNSQSAQSAPAEANARRLVLVLT